MSSKLSITYLTYSSDNPTKITTATATIAISQALQNLDSGQQTSQQTGYNAAETAARNLLRSQGFSPDGGVTFIPVSQIVSIVAS